MQLAAVIAVVLLLQAADEHTLFGQLFIALDRIVDQSVRSLSAAFNLKSFTESWLTSSLWIGYVYLVCLVILWLLRAAIGVASDLAGRWNLFWLRNAIAHERGIAAYRAWEPHERIRPDDFPRKNGKRHMPDPPTTSRPIRRWRTGCCAGRSATSPSCWRSPPCYRPSRRFRS